MLGTPAPHEQVTWLSPAQQQILEGLRGLTTSAARAALSAQLVPLLPAD